MWRAFPGAARHTKPSRVKRRRQHAVSPYSSIPALRAPHYDGKVIRWYVLQDPDYGIECLVNDRGGCCPRLDPYGSAIGMSYERGRRGRPWALAIVVLFSVFIGLVSVLTGTLESLCELLFVCCRRGASDEERARPPPCLRRRAGSSCGCASVP